MTRPLFFWKLDRVGYDVSALSIALSVIVLFYWYLNTVT